METIDIIVPVYNEEETLDAIKTKIEETDFCGLRKNIIFIDDGSTDSSREILSAYTDHIVIYHPKNQGKGAAIVTGLKNSKSDIVVIQDADLEYNPKDYQILLPHIISGEYDVVYGTRLKDKSQRKSFIFLSLFANLFLTLLTNILFNSKITDMETCYKAFRRTALDGIEIKSRRYDFEVEFTAKILRKGINIKEVPISYDGRTYAKGKKITAKDGVQAILALFYYRFFK